MGLDDVLGFLADVARIGATVFDAETGQRFTWHPDAAGIVDFARRATSGTRLEVIAKMQRNRETSEHLGGPGLSSMESCWSALARCGETHPCRLGTSRTSWRSACGRFTGISAIGNE